MKELRIYCEQLTDDCVAQHVITITPDELIAIGAVHRNDVWFINMNKLQVLASIKVGAPVTSVTFLSVEGASLPEPSEWVSGREYSAKPSKDKRFIDVVKGGFKTGEVFTIPIKEIWENAFANQFGDIWGESC